MIWQGLLNECRSKRDIRQFLTVGKQNWGLGLRPHSQKYMLFPACQLGINKQAEKPQAHTADLMHANSGTAVLDLAIDEHLNYPPNSNVITTGVYGLCPQG